jgi:N-methylhydantoinase B
MGYRLGVDVGGTFTDLLLFDEGDQLHFITWGGGWGDALDRDPALVGKEITQGLVTTEGAKAYGVIANAKGEVDIGATEILRAKLRAERPALALFNYSPPIEKLRTNCVTETGLAAPVQPVWATLEAAE